MRISQPDKKHSTVSSGTIMDSGYYLHSQDKNNYLHLITDAYSKQIMGYELSENILMKSLCTIQTEHYNIAVRNMFGYLIKITSSLVLKKPSKY